MTLFAIRAHDFLAGIHCYIGLTSQVQPAVDQTRQREAVDAAGESIVSVIPVKRETQTCWLRIASFLASALHIQLFKLALLLERDF